ncbi:MAG: phospholipid carrier-dependent glycosyltransferase [Candidatus Marinimicrobia bacterium]|nr:phospholipid carrier-dependent glycosyltransferase [Candidatus Neomarinimicrobiota bacterium]
MKETLKKITGGRVQLSPEFFISVNFLLFLLLVIKLLMSLLIHPDFGFHRDEFLYKAMGDHLAWGFLEVPPFMAVVAKITHALFGDGLYATRFFPALSGALTLLLTVLITREMGGGKFAEALAALAYLFSMVYLRINSLFQPVTFDLFFFVLGIYLFIRILKQNRPADWIMFGVVLGLGILNKYTMLFFGFGVFTGLLFTRYRERFISPWPWIAAAVVLIIWLPNLFWQHQQGWPFFEHMQALSESQLSNFRPMDFVVGQLIMSPFTIFIWLPGLYFLLFTERGKQFRPVGWVYLTVFTVLLLLNGKQYYLAPAYPMLFAAGSVMIEQFTVASFRWLRPALVAVTVAGGLLLAPVGIPIFSIHGMHQYFEFGSKYLGLGEALRWETGEYHELPQDFADMLGWEEQAAAVSSVFTGLPQEIQRRTSIIASNYGEAGALTHYRKDHPLPESILSVVGSFFTWGPPSSDTEFFITIGFSESTLSRYFQKVDSVGYYTHEHAREGELPLFLNKSPVKANKVLWDELSIYKFN